MLGLGDKFQYCECGSCGSLQNVEPPEEWGRYYPLVYYTHFLSEELPVVGLKALVAGWRDRAAATGLGSFGHVLSAIFPPPIDLQSLGRIPARSGMRILDFGCGSGRLLRRLYRAGLHQLAGVDPYRTEDTEIFPGVWLRRMDIHNITEKFDLVMLHHVLEHVINPLDTLRACAQLLSPKGRILVRLPIAGSAAWKRYGVNWVQLDAPRHLHLPSREGFGLLAQRAELQVLHQWNDSTEFQFWGSDLYQRGVSLLDKNGNVRRIGDYFSTEQIRTFGDEARRLNRIHEGDQLVTILAPTVGEKNS